MKIAFVREMTCYSVAAIILSFSTINACATVFRCTEAKEEAVLGTTGSVNSSHGNGKCRWSIDGASIEKNPAEAEVARNRTRNALNGLIDAAATGPSRNFSDPRQMSELLLGPFFGTSIPPSVMSSFESAFRSDANRFIECATRGGSVVSPDSRLLCRRISPDRDRVSDVWSMEVLPTEPLLVLGVSIENQKFMLFLPVRHIERRFQFR